jgi:hypothetical protein
MSCQILGKGLKRSWKKALGGLVLGFLLLPLPAFAGGFLTNWGLFQKQTGSAPHATYSADDHVNGGSLTINLGSYGNAGSSTVIASNFYYADYPSQVMTITEGVQAALKDANLKSDVTVLPISPGDPLYFTPPVGVWAANSHQSLNYNNSSTTYLPGGIYWVVVKIKSTNYNRFARTHDISPFTFTFTGI